MRASLTFLDRMDRTDRIHGFRIFFQWSITVTAPKQNLGRGAAYRSASSGYTAVKYRDWLTSSSSYVRKFWRKIRKPCAPTSFDCAESLSDNFANAETRRHSAVNDAIPHPHATDTDAVDAAALCAVLVLDASGKIVAANRSARHLWAAMDKSLVGFSFAELLAFAAVGGDPDTPGAQWKALSTAALNRSTPLIAKPLDGSSREVYVQLERALGGAGSYIATIQPRLPHPSAV
jgi:PAS domain-containing protein